MADKKGSIHHKYTEEELEFLKINYPTNTRSELTILFNKKFNLSLSEGQITAALKRYKYTCKGGCGFIKGYTPYNKGKKRTEWMSEQGIKKCEKTQFSKDKIVNKQDHIRLPTGTIRISKNGYVMVKTNEKQGNKARKYWKAKHCIIYEEKFGKIPKGHKVIFADGNNRNFDIDNLVLVSNAELAYMNKNKLYYKDFAEGTKTGALIAKIHMKGKERQNERKKQIR